MKLRSVKGRWWLVVPTVAVAATVLVGCDSKAGQAASVSGHHISQRTLSDYLGENPSDMAQARGIVLTTLVRDQLFNSLLLGSGGVPSDTELAAKHDDAVALQLSQAAPGAAGDKVIDDALAKIGIKGTFRNVLLGNGEKELVLADRYKAQDESVIAEQVTKAGLTVSINPRFGGWSAPQLSMTQFSVDQTPGNVTFTQLFPAAQGS